MWTYHEDELKEQTPLVLPTIPKAEKEKPALEKKPISLDKPEPRIQESVKTVRPRKTRRKCSEWYLAGIYLCGLVAGSVCNAFLSETLLRYVGYFTQLNLDLYQTANSSILFSTRFLSFFVQLTVIWLLGFCVFGKWFIPVALYIKGMGTGCFWIECIQKLGMLQGLLLRGLILWPPELIITLVMLQLGCRSLETSCALWRACRGDSSESLRLQSKRLVRCYLISGLAALAPCILSAFLVRVFGGFCGL